MTSRESSGWDLAAIVEVMFDDRIQCQCKDCGRVVYKQVHIIVWADGRIECWGRRCYERELGATPQGRTARPIYDLVDGRRLTSEERELLRANREQLIAKFREDQLQKEQAKREAQETLRRASERNQQFLQPGGERRERRHATARMEPMREREGICRICAKKTADWWYYDGRTGICECHDCQRQVKTQPERGTS